MTGTRTTQTGTMTVAEIVGAVVTPPLPAQVVDFPQAGHDDLSDDPRYGEALARFMSQSMR